MKKAIALLMILILAFSMFGCDMFVPLSEHTDTPYIQDGYWYLNGVNTGVKAEGVDGKDGANGQDGIDGVDGKDGVNGQDGIDGKDGKSAYELFCETYSYTGTEEQWLQDLMSGGLIGAQNPVNSLTVAIIGDSISTKEGRNAVEITVGELDVGVKLSAYPTYYDIGTVIGGHTIVESDIGKELTFTPTTDDIGKTLGNPKNYNPASTTVWWEHLEESFGCTVNPVCWSGSSYSSHEDSNIVLKNSYAWHESQIRKLGTRVEGGMERIAPDVIILYRGGNDMTHSPYGTLTDGYFDNCDWAYPQNDRVDGGWGVKEAMSLTVMKIREAYPNAKIVFATQTTFKRVDYDNFPTNNNLYSLPQLNAAIREVADFFGCYTIDFDKCGITFENCYTEGYITDSATKPVHPSTKGHALMGKQAVGDLLYKVHLDVNDYVIKEFKTNVLYEKTGVETASGVIIDNSAYFSYDLIPVEAGKTYYMPHCRNTVLLDARGDIVRIVRGADMEANGYRLTVPAGIVYLRTCARYDAISVAEFSITEVE